MLQIIPILGREWKLSFDLILYGKRNSHGSIVHLTIGNNYKKYGDRTPAIWTREKSTQLFFRSAVNGEKDHGFTTKNDIPLNKITHIEVGQKKMTNGKYQYTIYIDKSQVYTIENTKAESFNNVKVYAADPWHEPADGDVKNLTILNGMFHFSICLSITLYTH